ncbi:hypothetical protein [Steroidobacter agaridevorans]|nr:hypothetical protein [Steroidobacter agaridevorans]
MYAELKTWQPGLAALLGFTGLIVAALWNFSLNRRRDAALRREEANSVAAALYGEMVLLRARAAQVGRSVAKVHVRAGTGRTIIGFDKHFVEAHKLPEPALYKALASKFGLLPSHLVVSITAFYENIQMIGFWLAQLPKQDDRPYSYSPLYVLRPARDAVHNVVPALSEIEAMIGVAKQHTHLDISDVENVIAFEEEGWSREE